MDDLAAPPASRGLRFSHALLALLLALHLLRVPYAATHLDFARDLFVAWRFLHGEEVPLAGPVLAGTIHLGPVWYWLLAVLLALARSWFGVVALLGLLSATQVILAWRLGRALHGERAGLLWAALLAVPAWSSFEWMLPQHYVLTAPLVLAFLLCAVRYVQRRRMRWLVGMALTFVFALHAHPSSLGLAWIGLGVFVHALATRTFRPLDWLAAACVAALPLLPYLYWSLANDFADFRAGGAYLLDGQSTGTIANAGSLLQAVAFGGTRYWLEVLLAWPPAATTAATALLVLAFGAGLYGLLRQVREPDSRRLALLALGSVAALALTTALIRHQTTYYMTTPLRVVVLGAVALGLAQLRAPPAALLRGATVAFAIGLNLIGAVAAARFAVNGNWPFDFQALFDVGGARGEPQRLLLLPAYAMRDSGEFLCGETAPSLHGAYARHLLYDYAMEMRLGCMRSDAEAGGDSAARSHWLGLARDTARTAALVPARRVGALALFPVRRVLAGDAFAMPDRPLYPVHLPRVNPREQRRYRVALRPGEHLAISTTAFFVGAAEVEFAAAARPVQLRAADAVTRVYGCAGCAPGESLEFELLLTTQNFSDTDAVIF
ncbi:glycosyltransferase family 39 protein [Tahibacter caeni]|uniref:glycosyltransferase family 39 protein n=1 Tax=Tahibacter caeni TaxID=1453545 RepID=UPI002147C60A|nr:glycosyltransferase family 39 protein [Tahibacter caeni]